MFRLRSVAGFASHTDMAAGLFHIENVAMAGFAGFVAGIGNRLGHNFLKGIAAIVAILPETPGNQKAPDDREKEKTDGKDRD